MRKNWFFNVLLLIVSLVLSVAAAELALRYVIKPRAVLTQQLLKGLGVTDSDQNWLRDADLGWMIRPNATFNHVSPYGEFDTTIRTDALGMRIPLNGGRERAERNILFVGDSMTAAYEVPYDDTFVAKVESSLRAAGQNVRTLNAGIRGYSTEQALKRMKSLLDHAELGISDVVYTYALNDPFENMSLHFPKRLMSKPGAYLDSDGALRFRSLDFPVGVFDSEALFVEPGGRIGVLPVIGREGSKIGLMANVVRYKEPEHVLDHSYFYTLFRMALSMWARPADASVVKTRYPYINAEYIEDSFGGYSPGFIDVSWEPDGYPLRLLENIILAMKAEAHKRGVRFWLALPLSLGHPSLPFFDSLAKKGVAVIDPVSDGFRDRWRTKCGGAIIFRSDGHYNACGHSGQAESIAAALKETEP